MPPMIQTFIHTRNTPSNCAPADHWGLSAASHRMPHAPLSNTLHVLVDQRGLSVTAVAKGLAKSYASGLNRPPRRHPARPVHAPDNPRASHRERHRIIPQRTIRWRPGRGRSGALCARGDMLLCRANHARLKSSADSLGRKAARDFRSRKKIHYCIYMIDSNLYLASNGWPLRSFGPDRRRA